MPFEDDTQALADILENIRLINDFTSDMPFAAFASDKRTLYAVARCLEIISEASRRLTDATRGRYDLPWRAIMDLGNFYRHEYHKVLSDRVWTTALRDLVPLTAAVEHELRARGVSEPEDTP